jgi:hypothetical protein
VVVSTGTASFVGAHVAQIRAQATSPRATPTRSVVVPTSTLVRSAPIAHATVSPTPTVQPTAVPARPTPVPTLAPAKPTADPSPIRASVPTTVPTRALAAAASPTPIPTTPQTWIVGHTDGLGVYIRRTTNPDDRIKIWLDGTPMTIVGPDQVVGGTTWKNVRDPDGTVGWIPAQYLESPGSVVAGTTVETDNKLAFANQPTLTAQGNGAAVAGLIKNNSGEELSGVLRALLQDAKGNTLATASGVVNDVPPGQSRVYVLLARSLPAGTVKVVPQVVVTRPVTQPLQVGITNVAIKSRDNRPVVVGQVQNDDTAPYSLALLAGFVDANGNVVGVARGVVGGVDSGQTQSFTLAAPDQVTGYKNVVVQIATAAQIDSNSLPQPAK